MIVRTRIRVAIATVALGTVGLLGMAACSGGSPAAAGSLSPEQSALTALGFTADDVSGTTAGNTVTATASTAPDKGKGKHPLARRLAIRRLALRGHVEHGQVTVETKKNGDQTIDVQRGTVTAISATSMTVKSTDGFSWTWTLSGSPKVIVNRAKSQISAVTTGATVGVAGTGTGTSPTAKLVVVPSKTPKPAAS